MQLVKFWFDCLNQVVIDLKIGIAASSSVPDRILIVTPPLFVEPSSPQNPCDSLGELLSKFRYILYS